MKTKQTLPVALFCLFFAASGLRAQTPTDGITMARYDFCTGFLYSHSFWDQYWEGGLKRANDNIGTFHSRQVLWMGAYGITDRLNVMAMLPWVYNDAPTSQFASQRGLQDLSVWLKYRLGNADAMGNGFSFFPAIGASTPITNYPKDFLPFSLGVGARTLQARGILHYQLPSGPYVTGHAGYALRGNVHADRDAFQVDGEVYASNEVPVPDMWEAGLRIGFLKPRYQVEVNVSYFDCTSGDNIRRQDMPFPTNDMEGSNIGVLGKYFITPRLSLWLLGSYTLQGRNIGQSTMYSGGFAYIFTLKKPAAQ